MSITQDQRVDGGVTDVAALPPEVMADIGQHVDPECEFMAWNASLE
jgi:hypothetical protein